MKCLPIAFIADRNFFTPSVVAITSLLENKRSESAYKIYLVNIGFSDEQKKKVRLIEERYSTSIVMCDVDENQLYDRYKNLVKHDCCASISALVKFDLPNICREENYLLYLDGDLIVQKDLSELLELKFADKEYVKAVKDTGLLYSSTLIRQPVKDYFNSGVMYLNLAAMRRDGVSEVLVEEKYKSTDNSLMDQHVLNIIFENNKELLPHKFNVLYMNLIRAHYFYGISIEQLNELMCTSYAGWDDMLQQATVVHYSSFDKPWKYSDVDGVEVWNKYFEKSIVKDVPLKRKKLHIKLINKMRACKYTALIGTFIWEVETKGMVKSLKDVKKYLVSKVKK